MRLTHWLSAVRNLGFGARSRKKIQKRAVGRDLGVHEHLEDRTLLAVASLTISDDEPATVANIAGGTITYTFTFTETVNGFTVGEVTVVGGTKDGTFATGADGSSVYTLVVTPEADFEGNLTVDVAAGVAQSVTGGENNLAATQSVQQVDTLAPTLTIVRASTNPTLAATVNYTVTFSEDVANVGVNDFTLTTDVAGASVASVTPINGSTYTVTVNTGTTDGTINLDFVGSPTINDIPFQSVRMKTIRWRLHRSLSVAAL